MAAENRRRGAAERSPERRADRRTKQAPAPASVAEERRARIAAEVRRRGGATVSGLARACGVSAGTIRRDLRALEAGGVLHKVYGGAVAPEVVAAVAPVTLAHLTRAAPAAAPSRSSD